MSAVGNLNYVPIQNIEGDAVGVITARETVQNFDIISTDPDTGAISEGISDSVDMSLDGDESITDSLSESSSVVLV